MKKAKMKIYCAIMAAIMVVSASPSAFAAAIIDVPSGDEIFLQSDGHGQYTEGPIYHTILDERYMLV